MEIYLDSGNLDEIAKAAETGLIDGVTTNPTLVRKEGVPFEELISRIVSILKKAPVHDNFTVSAEVTASDHQDMIKQGRELVKIDSHVIVKVPLTEEGLKAVKVFSKEKIRTNVTLCFSTNQALLAAKAGAYIISPFIGREDDVGEDGSKLIEDIKKIYSNYGFQTKILAASIRSAKTVRDVSLLGADISTVPYDVFTKLFHHPLTDSGLAKFNSDWEEYNKRTKPELLVQAKGGDK